MGYVCSPKLLFEYNNWWFTSCSWEDGVHGQTTHILSCLGCRIYSCLYQTLSCCANISPTSRFQTLQFEVHLSSRFPTAAFQPLFTIWKKHKKAIALWMIKSGHGKSTPWDVPWPPAFCSAFLARHPSSAPASNPAAPVAGWVEKDARGRTSGDYIHIYIYIYTYIYIIYIEYNTTVVRPIVFLLIGTAKGSITLWGCPLRRCGEIVWCRFG